MIRATARRVFAGMAGRHWIVALAMTKSLGSGMLMVGLPVKLDRLGWSDWDLGLFWAVYAATYTVACALYSLVLDRLPLRRMMAGSSVVCAVVAVGFWVFSFGPLVFLLGATFALATAFFWPSLMAWIGESDDARLVGDMSAFNCAWTVALTTGFVLGGLAETLLRGVSLLVVAGVSVVLALVIPLAHIHGRTGFAGMAVSPPTTAILPRRFMFAGWLAAFLVTLAVAVPGAIFVKLNSALGYTPRDYGAFMGLRGGVQAFTVLALGVFQGWRYRRWPLVACLVLSAAGSALLAAPLGKTVLALGFMLLGVGMGMGYSTGFYYSVHGRRNPKRGAGIFEAIISSQSVIGGPMGGLVASLFGRRIPYLVVAALATLGAVGQHRFLRGVPERLRAARGEEQGPAAPA